jgi:hypothetical protein
VKNNDEHHHLSPGIAAGPNVVFVHPRSTVAIQKVQSSTEIIPTIVSLWPSQSDSRGLHEAWGQ